MKALTKLNKQEEAKAEKAAAIYQPEGYTGLVYKSSGDDLIITYENEDKDVKTLVVHGWRGISVEEVAAV